MNFFINFNIPKMFLKRIILFLFLLNFATMNAQEASGKSFHYASSGIFPTVVINNVQKEMDADIVQRSSYKLSYPQKLKMDTVIYNDVFLYNMLLSGEVLYDDSVGMYVNKVAAELLKNEPETFSKLHFFILRSPVVETYSFDKGYVFISTALVAQLENEAQFAFIIAREIAHYKKKHLTLMKMQDELDLYNRNQYTFSQLYTFLKIPFTQSQEMEADNDALESIKNSGYPLSSIEQAFDLFEYKHLPFDDLVFEHAFFEQVDYKLPDTLFLKKITPVSSYVNKTDHSKEDDAIHDRRGVMEESLNIKEAGKRKFILPKQEFINVREKARFIVAEDYLAGRDYINAIYASYMLLKKYPNDEYLKTIVSKSLYAISISKSASSRNPTLLYIGIPDACHPTKFETHVFFDYEEKEGNSQSLYYFFNQIDASELDAMAVVYTWNAYKKTGNVELKSIADSLLSELFIINRMRGSSFSRFTKEELLLQDSVASNSFNGESSKYDKIKSLQIKNDANTVENRLKFVFVNLFKEDEFSKMFDRSWNASRKRNGDAKVALDLSLKGVNISKIVVVDPTFTSSPSRGDSFKKDLEKCQFQKRKYTEMLTSEMKKNSINFQFMDGSDSILDKNIYNDRAILHAWIVEREKNGCNPDALVLSAGNYQELVAKYGSPYFVFSGMRTSTDTHGPKTIYTFKVYNILTGELVQFNANVEGYIATAQDLSVTIAFSVKELAKKSTKQ